MFNLKRATAGAFSVPFRELIGIYHSAFIKFTSRRYSKQSSLSLLKLRKCVVLESVPLLGAKKFSSHAHKTRSWYLLGFVSKISNEHPRPFHIEVPPPGIINIGRLHRPTIPRVIRLEGRSVCSTEKLSNDLPFFANFVPRRWMNSAIEKTDLFPSSKVNKPLYIRSYMPTCLFNKLLPHRAASYFCLDISTSGYPFVNSSQAPLRRKSAIGEFMVIDLNLRPRALTVCWAHSLMQREAFEEIDYFEVLFLLKQRRKHAIRSWRIFNVQGFQPT